MTPCPKIVTHESADAPPAHRFVAGFYTATGERLPMLFHAPEKDAAINAAAHWWADQQARLAKDAANRAARSARMRKDG